LSAAITISLPSLRILIRQSLRVLSLMSDHIGQYNPKESEAVRKELVFQVMLAALWSGLVNPALFIGKSHALKACFYLINVTIVS